MKLQRIPVPFWPPPHPGPWRVRWTRPTGEHGLGAASYAHEADAEQDALACRRHCRQGCSYDVVPDPGGARWTIP